MRLLPICAAATLAVALTGSLIQAQAEKDDSHPARVFGYQDARTGVFHPMPSANAQASPQQVTPAHVNGTYKIRISTKLLTPLVAGQQLVCGATIDVFSLIGSDIPIEQKITGAEAVSSTGKSAICTITLPFDWVLPTDEADYLANGSWYVEVVNPAAYPRVRRSYTGETGAMAFPASGETATFNASHSL
jgi:hypothetical protein